MKARLWFVPMVVVVSLAAAAGGAWAADRPATPAVYPVQEQFVDADGVLIYTLSVGRGAPLVVLHGGPGASHDYFLPYLLPLARHNRLVFIDERGSGRSEKLEDASRHTVEAMVADVEAVRVALGLGKINLLGHSLGGVLAQAYAFAHQANLGHLVLASTFHSTNIGTRSGVVDKPASRSRQTGATHPISFVIAPMAACGCPGVSPQHPAPPPLPDRV